MYSKLFIFALPVLFLTSKAFVLYPFKLNVILNDTYDVTVNWDLNYDDQVVNFAVEVQGSSKKFQWFLLGFSDFGEYENSDVCFFRNGNVFDGYIDTTGAIRRDQKQNCGHGRVIEMPDGRFVFIYSRQFNTCDRQDIVIEPGSTQILVAIGKSYRKNIFGKYVTKKIVANRLLRSFVPPPKIHDDVQEFVVGPENIQIPAADTTYWCTVVLLPRMVQQNHIVRYEAAITPGNEEFVHHMEVYHCETPQSSYRMPKFSSPCTEQDRPPELKSCRKVIAAWAMGADPFIYPEEAGVPIGGNNYFPFVLIETHYNNPKIKSGVQDSSGIRIFYTPNLRKYDAGILEVGLIYSDAVAIPPGQQAFPVSGYCTPECTETGFPAEGITIFASQLHAHLTGHRLYTVQVREGVEVREINRDNHFVTHYQEIRHLVHPAKILPGDSLVTTCLYDTRKRKNVTTGAIHETAGFYVADLGAIFQGNIHRTLQYVEILNIQISFLTFLRVSHVQTLLIEDQGTSPEKSVAENYQWIEWNSRRVMELQLFYRTAPIRMECLQNNGEQFQGNWENQEKPEILYPRPHETTTQKC